MSQVRSMLMMTLCIFPAYADLGANSAAGSFSCTSDWTGPSILLDGHVLPLPQGYSLVDRTVGPHEFSYSGIPSGIPPGRIAAGRADGFLEETLSSTDDSEFHISDTQWRGIRRITLVHRKSSLRIEIFAFPNEIILAFYGSAVQLSDDLAGCYAVLSGAS